MAKMINIKTRGDVESLVEKNFNGKIAKFLIDDTIKYKRYKLIRLINQLIDILKDAEIMYEGKINYAFRNKRIDIVIYKNRKLILGTYSDITKIDKKAIELDQIINSEKEKICYKDIKIIACIFCDKEIDSNVIDNINNLLENKTIFLNISINNNLHLINNVLFN